MKETRSHPNERRKTMLSELENKYGFLLKPSGGEIEDAAFEQLLQELEKRKEGIVEARLTSNGNIVNDVYDHYVSTIADYVGRRVIASALLFSSYPRIALCLSPLYYSYSTVDK